MTQSLKKNNKEINILELVSLNTNDNGATYGRGKWTLSST